MTSRFTTLVGIITTTTLLFQIAILLRTQCYIDRRTISLANSLQHRDKYRSIYFQRPTTLISRPEPSVGIPIQKHTTKRWLTIGIPTIQRRDGRYFLNMLDSILNKTQPHQIDKIYVVVFLADFNKTEWKDEMEKNLTRKYPKYFDVGTLKIIRAPREFYSRFNASSVANRYWYWRTKQNYDYSFIMQYCQGMSEYYMQMEDDVITADGYLNSIEAYMRKQKDDNWVCLEFSQLGFIGKLYHSKDLKGLVQMFMIFSETQPVDFTYLYYNILKGQGQRSIRKPTLFQHMGYHSSLPDKIQALKDQFFSLPNKKYSADNPEADIHTTFTVYSDFPPQLAYTNESGYFWSGASAKQGDVFTMRFKVPQLVEKVIVETGTKEHSTDIISVGVVEASTILVDDKQPPYCKDFVVIGQFIDGVANITDVHSKMGVFTTKCLQIRITQDQIPWVIIREIAIWTQK